MLNGKAGSEIPQVADDEPVKVIKPWPTQQRCYDSKARYRYIGGANRKGKTAWLCVELVASALRVHPNKSTSKNVTYLVLAPSREQLQDPWAKKLLDDCEIPGFDGIPFLAMEHIAHSRGRPQIFYTHGAGQPTLKQINLANGNVIKFGVSKDVEGWKRKAGTALFGIILDESEGDENMLNEMYPRLLDANKDPLIVAEAGGGWILWGATATTQNRALRKFIDNCDSQEKEHADWEAFHFTAEEGSKDDAAERERLRAAFTGDDYEVRMTGKARFEDRLLIYAHLWNEDIHMAKEDYIVKPDDNLWCAYDPGGAGRESHDTGIMFVAVNRERPKLLRIVKCMLSNKTTLSYDFQQIAHYLAGRTLQGLVYDIAGNKTEKITGKSLVTQMQEEIKRLEIKTRRLMACYNRHEPGIKRFQTYLEEGLIQANPSKPSGGLMFRQEVLGYRSYEPGVYQGNRGVVKMYDELVDCGRYIVMALNRGMTRIVYHADRGCGEPTITPTPLQPQKEAPWESMPEDQRNYQMQLERSARLTAKIRRPVFKT